jgi:hypothetical protein
MKVRKHISIDHDLLEEFMAKQPEGFNFSAWVTGKVKASLWLEEDGENGGDDQDD